MLALVPLLFIVNHYYMFQSQWPSSCVQVTVLKESDIVHIYSNCLGLSEQVDFFITTLCTPNDGHYTEICIDLQ
jgi:hypothetical protein